MKRLVIAAVFVVLTAVPAAAQTTPTTVPKGLSSSPCAIDPTRVPCAPPTFTG